MIKKEEELEQKERSRAKYDCPKKLARLIEIVNGLPMEGLPDVFDYVERAREKLPKEVRSNLTPTDSLKLGVREIIDDLGQRAGWFVMGIFNEAFAHVGRLPQSNTIDDILQSDVVLAFIGYYANHKRDRDNLLEFTRTLDDIRKGKRTKMSIVSERYETVLIPTK